MGSLKNPCRTFYWSSIETIARDCLVFRENHVFCMHYGNRQTNGRTNRQTDGQYHHVKSLSQAANNRLNSNHILPF